jgi:hypothetical protein
LSLLVWVGSSERMVDRLSARTTPGVSFSAAFSPWRRLAPRPLPCDHRWQVRSRARTRNLETPRASWTSRDPAPRAFRASPPISASTRARSCASRSTLPPACTGWTSTGWAGTAGRGPPGRHRVAYGRDVSAARLPDSGGDGARGLRQPVEVRVRAGRWATKLGPAQFELRRHPEIALAELGPTGSGRDYVSSTSGDGEARMRVRCTRSSNFVASGELMRITYQR